jgi:hypothetical protein
MQPTKWFLRLPPPRGAAVFFWEPGGGGLASPAALTPSTLRQPLGAAAAGTTAAGTTATRTAALLLRGFGTDARAFVDAALARACVALTGARHTAAAAVTGRVASILAAVDPGNDGHEAQRRPQEETLHGKTLCALRN